MPAGAPVLLFACHPLVRNRRKVNRFAPAARCLSRLRSRASCVAIFRLRASRAPERDQAKFSGEYLFGSNQVLTTFAGRSACQFRSFHSSCVRIKSRRWQARTFPYTELLSVAAIAVLNSLQVKTNAQPAIRRNEVREHRVRRLAEK